MAQRVSIQQAARNALARWLTCELAAEDVHVEPRWVESDQLLRPKQMTIIDAGPRDVEWLDPEALKITNVDEEGGRPVKKADVIWQLGFITQPVQLDVWARSDVELDDLLSRLDGSLNKGERGLGITNTDPFRPGLLLPLLDGWTPGVVDFLFEEPVILQAPSSAGEGEWRAMYRGRATAQLTQQARSPRIARILLEQRLYVSDADTTAETEQTVIVPEP